MTQLYFAYDRLMAPDNMKQHCPSCGFVRYARVDNYRLVFIRPTQSEHLGCPAIVRHRGFAVWGAIYEISDSDLKVLDRERGCQSKCRQDTIEAAYNVTEGQLLSVEFTNVITHVVDDDYSERRPATEELQSIIDSASDRGLPWQYVEFLKTLDKSASTQERDGLLAGPTLNRSGAKGRGIARLAPKLVRSLSLGPWAVVSHRNRSVLIRVVKADDLDDTTCQLDQNIRSSLGFPDDYCYGHMVSFHRPSGGLPSYPFVSVRTLALPVEKPSRADAEKNLCVMHPRNIQLLGLSEGDYVEVLAVTSADRQSRVNRVPRSERRVAPGAGAVGRLPVRRLTVRVFGGSGTIPEDTTYPNMDTFYIDLDGRQSLGIDGSIGHPVLVTPSVGRLAGRLIGSRLLLSGLTLVVSADAVLRLLETLTGLGSRGNALIAIGFALVVTAVVTVVDVRAEMQY